MATIAVTAVDGMPLFHLSVPGEVFGTDRTDMGVPLHEVRVVAAEPGPLRADGGLVLQTSFGLEALHDADLVIVPWWRHHRGEWPPEPLLEALVEAHSRGVPVAGLCGGAFVLAAAGLLDGRRATTHWHYADKLAEMYPSVHVNQRVLYIDEGDVLTSAGTAAGIDLCLHLRRRLDGAEVANTVARRMVVQPHRSGGQAQFIAAPVPTVPQDDRLARTMAWAVEHLDRTVTVDDLARHALMGRRTFTRNFRAATGSTPVQWLLNQRLQLAQRLLETTNLSVESLAARCGFGSAVALRGHFRRTLGTSPIQYRRTFSHARPAGLELTD